MYGTASDEQLMSLICKGERTAFEVLYDRYFDKLVWYANSFIDDMHKSEDVIQDVFIKIIERPEQFNTERKFSTWVYTVTANACKNTLRNELNRQRIIREQIRPPSTTITHSTADARRMEQKLEDIRAGFSEKEKNIYTLRFEHGLTVREISGITDIPEGTIKSGIYYLLRKIAAHLKDFTHEQ